MLTLPEHTEHNKVTPEPAMASTLELSQLAPEDQYIVLLALHGHELGGALLESSDFEAAASWVNRLMALRRAVGFQNDPQRLPLNCGYEQLTGGIDVMSTLVQAQSTHYTSVLARADRSLLLLPSPERQSSENLHALCCALDSGQISGEQARVCVIANVHRNEAGQISRALIDRLTFHVLPQNVDALASDGVLSEHSVACAPLDIDHCVQVIDAASNRSVQLNDEHVYVMCEAAVAHGIDSMRATLQCARVARASAALAGRDTANDGDIGLAMSLCFAWRAATVPPNDVDVPQDENADTDDPVEPDSANDNTDSTASQPTQSDTNDAKQKDDNQTAQDAEPAQESDSMVVSLPEKLLSAIANAQRNALTGQQASGRKSDSFSS